MTKLLDVKEIVGHECRFATYCPPPEGSSDDIHLVKEIVHYSDGTVEPRVRALRNFKRPYWITKKGFQNHNDKKEWEDLDKLNYFESTQTDLHRNIAKSLNVFGFSGDARKLLRSPYVYGADILSTAVIKEKYQSKYPGLITPCKSAMFDIETDVVRGSGDIIMATLSFGTKVITAIRKDFVGGYSDVTRRLQELMTRYLGSVVEERKIEWEIIYVDHSHEIIIECFKRAHQWMPDFVAIWNIDFDMPKMLVALDKARIDPKDVFSDPSVSKQYRFFKYKPGSAQKKTASGKLSPVKPPARWHTVFCPSSFYFIDAMCGYKHIRTGSADEPSYSLDNILDKHLGFRKLKFAEADGMVGIEWHQFMQEKCPLEYVIYNVFDCVSMEILDEKTNDLSLTLPLFSGCSDFANFRSQPRRLVDSLHYFALENKRAIGTTSDQMATDLDLHTTGVDGWINKG